VSDLDDDAALLTAWSDGDADAGNRLLGRYFDRLLVFFGPRAERDVEDLVQRTMLSCVRARGSVQRASSFRAFLFTTAKHELIDHYRRRTHALPSAEPDEAVCDRTTPSQFAIGREQRRSLARALQTLDVDLQIVVALHYWEGMTNVELAETLEIPLGTVKSRLRRAKEALKESLLERGTGADADQTLASLDAWAQRAGRRGDEPDEDSREKS
jgi:RNA polymerase sigma-70 factor (ECF subfamily)